jgi:hypothetical protein
MDEPRLGTALTVSVCVNATVTGRFQSVNDLERAVLLAAQRAGCELYVEAFKAFQSAWLECRRDRFIAQRWRRIGWCTPFGPVELPVRVVRENSSGKYHTLSKVLWRRKATRRLSPALEELAAAEATAQNYRPAARSLSRWIGNKVGHWLVWACVQFHGARHLLELEKLPPPAVRRLNPPALITEVDSTFLKAQQRNRRGGPRHFPVHLGLHYTGRIRRYQARGSKSVRLQNKILLATTEPLALFGSQMQREALRRFQPQHHLILSDGEEGLRWLRQKHFPQATWLLDRWHITQAVRAFVADNQSEYHRLLQPVWRAQSEAVLEALRTSPLRFRRPKEFRELFSYILGSREGIDAWKTLPASLRRSIGRTAAPVKCGSGAVEKNIEVEINRRFKRQGRSWNRLRAQRLLQLKLLLNNPRLWKHWWSKPKPLTPKPNPP